MEMPAKEKIYLIVSRPISIFRKKKQEFLKFKENKIFYKIAKEGFDVEYGARPLKRSIQKELENELSELILQGTIKSGDVVEATVKEGKMAFQVK